MQPRLLDLERAGARAAQACSTAPSLDEAITWLEIHGDRPDVVAHWRTLQAQGVQTPAHDQAAEKMPFRGAGGEAAAALAIRRAAGVTTLEGGDWQDLHQEQGVGDQHSASVESLLPPSPVKVFLGATRAPRRTGSRRRAPSAGAAALPDPSRCSAAAGR